MAESFRAFARRLFDRDRARAWIQGKGEACRASTVALSIVAAIFNSALGPLAAQTAPRVEVSARVDRADVTLGDRVRYEITVAYPSGGAVALPAVKGNIGRFELQDYRVSAVRDSAGRAYVTHTLDLASFTLGEDTLPPQRIEYRAAGDTAAWATYTPPTFARVKRITAENAMEIADIDETGKLPGTFPWGLLLLAALALAFWRYRAWRKKNPRRRAQPKRAPLTPYEVALERLRVLEASRLDPEASARGREFAFELSEILREYLGLRYDVDALEATTAELITRTAALPYPPESHAWLRDVSWELDTVKFATGVVSSEEAARWIQGARAFLETTVETPVATTPETAAETKRSEFASAEPETPVKIGPPHPAVEDGKAP